MEILFYMGLLENASEKMTFEKNIIEMCCNHLAIQEASEH